MTTDSAEQRGPLHRNGRWRARHTQPADAIWAILLVGAGVANGTAPNQGDER